MARIEGLTPEQELSLAELRDQCWNRAISTEPCDRPRFEAAILDLYEQFDSVIPEFLWVEGMGAALALVSASTEVGAESRRLAELLSEGRFGVAAGEELTSIFDSLLKSLRPAMGSAFDGDLPSRLELWLGSTIRADIRQTIFWNWLHESTPVTTTALGERARERLHRELKGARVENLRSDTTLAMRRCFARLTNKLPMPGTSWRDRADGDDYGIFSAFNIGFSSFHMFARELGVDYQPAMRVKHDIVWNLCNSGFWFWPGRKVCICCERPSQFSFDAQFRLHNEAGPAMAFRDGFKVYSIHGVELPELVVMRPQEITVEEIEAEENAEVRRIMTERFGYGRYLSETGAQVIDMDVIAVNTLDESFGSMPRALMVDKQGQRWLVGTDGSTKRVYYMRAPNEANTCAEAHSALAGFDENQIIASS